MQDPSLAWRDVPQPSRPSIARIAAIALNLLVLAALGVIGHAFWAAIPDIISFFWPYAGPAPTFAL
jgi:hypothetical protein